MSTSAMDRLAIIIVNYNTLELLQRCLAVLDAQGIARDRIFVVDNASTDGSRAWLETERARGVTVLLPERNIGYAAGNNLALALALGRGDTHCLLLNTDAYPHPGAIERLLCTMDDHPRAGIVGSQLLFESGRWQRSDGPIHSSREAMLEALGVYSLMRATAAVLWPLTGRFWPARRAGYVDCACALLRGAMLLEIGLMDESYFFYAEDVELSRRACSHGWQVIQVPAARVTHLRGGSAARKDPRRAMEMKRNALRRLVESAEGPAGWERYRGWMERNFRWRLAACRLLARLGVFSSDRCNAYAVELELYRSESTIRSGNAR